MKKKLLLPIYLGLSLILIITAVVMSLTLGVNLGVDFNGGKQVEIKLEENANTDSYDKTINEVLKNYNLSIDSSVTQDKYTDTYYVFKINTNEISAENANKIRSEIAAKLNLQVENVSEIMPISGNVTEKTLITISIAVGCIFLVFFFISWIRYGIMNGLATLFTALHSMIISFALVLITRLQINIPTVIAVLVSCLFTLIIYTFILESVRDNKVKHNNELTDAQMFKIANKKALPTTIIIASALLVFAIASFFNPMSYIKLFAFALIECIAVSVYSANCVGFELGSSLSTIKTEIDKQKLSKNVEPKKSKR